MNEEQEKLNEDFMPVLDEKSVGFMCAITGAAIFAVILLAAIFA